MLRNTVFLAPRRWETMRETLNDAPEVLDASFINCKMLRRFFEEQIADAKDPMGLLRDGRRVERGRDF